MNLKQTLSALLAAGVLCGTLPAAGAANAPKVEYETLGNSSEITLSGIDAEHVHSAQLELTLTGSSEVEFSRDDAYVSATHKVNEDHSTTVTLYIDRYGDLNDGGTAFLGVLKFPNVSSVSFDQKGTLKLLDDKLQTVGSWDVSVSRVTDSSNPGGDGSNPGDGSGSGGGSGSSKDDGKDSGKSYKPSVSASEGGSVKVSPSSAKKGDKVTITVKPDAGYVLSELIVTDSKGREIKLRDLGDGRYTFTMPDGKPEIEAVFARASDGVQFQPAGIPFTDVPANEWYYSAVDFVYRNGMMSGTSGTAFSPNLPTNRAMIVSILYRLEGSPAAGANTFPDVAPGQYYTDAVGWAAANGIVSGYSTGDFRPGDGITREQLAAILYRYAQYKGYNISASADLGRFPDAGNVSKYAVGPMQWAAGQGLVSGTSRGTLDPAGGASRAQAAAILMRFCQSLAGMQ